MEKNYNYIFDESGKVITISKLNDYRKLPEMTAELILKNNKYVRDMERLKLSCIDNDIVHDNFNGSGAMYVLFIFILKRFDFLLECENISTEERDNYLKEYEELVPYYLYEAKYLQYVGEKPPIPDCNIHEVNNLPKKIRVIFYLAKKTVCERYIGMSSCFHYIEKVLFLPDHEARATKNVYGNCLNIMLAFNSGVCLE